MSIETETIINVLTEQHRMIEWTFEKISLLLTSKMDPGIEKKLETGVRILAGQLISHFEQENHLVFVWLSQKDQENIQPANDGTKETAEWFQKKTIENSSFCKKYFNRWKTAENIADNLDLFLVETETLIKMLKERIKREETQIFPIFNYIDLSTKTANKSWLEQTDIDCLEISIEDDQGEDLHSWLEAIDL